MIKESDKYYYTAHWEEPAAARCDEIHDYYVQDKDVEQLLTQKQRKETLKVLGSSLPVTGDSALGGRDEIYCQHYHSTPLTDTVLRWNTCQGLASSCRRDCWALVCKRMKRQFSMKHFSLGNTKSSLPGKVCSEKFKISKWVVKTGLSNYVGFCELCNCISLFVLTFKQIHCEKKGEKTPRVCPDFNFTDICCIYHNSGQQKNVKHLENWLGTEKTVTGCLWAPATRCLPPHKHTISRLPIAMVISHRGKHCIRPSLFYLSFNCSRSSA